MSPNCEDNIRQVVRSVIVSGFWKGRDDRGARGLMFSGGARCGGPTIARSVVGADEFATPERENE
jgi:hypothetical protein